MAPSNGCSGCDRRRFLLTTAGVAVATQFAGALSSGCGAGASAPPGVQTSGLTVADLAVGSAITPSGANYIVARDANGVYAYSNVCTHQGCAVPAPANGGVSTCPCHGAQFDALGDNVRANGGGSGHLPDLSHYRVTFDGTGDTATIVVDTSIVESDRAARATPPAAGANDAGTPSDAGAPVDAGGPTARWFRRLRVLTG